MLYVKYEYTSSEPEARSKVEHAMYCIQVTCNTLLRMSLGSGPYYNIIRCTIFHLDICPTLVMFTLVPVVYCMCQHTNLI